MRRILNFSCEGATLWATLDEGAEKTGLLIVSGGNEIRIGAHRGMAKLARDIASAGYPVFRFDRRGIGDSEGENGEFTSSASDLAAAVSAFQHECRDVSHIVAFGNCDASSALALHNLSTVDGLILANPWVIEKIDEMPPPAAIRARYIERIKDPSAWLALLKGGINLKKLANGLFRIAQRQKPSSLAQSIADGIFRFSGPISILLARRDATAIAFFDAWQKPEFASARSKGNIIVQQIDSGSHSFASDEDYAALQATILAGLASRKASPE